LDKSIKKIYAELLYRLTRDGDDISTFHALCDNKGPTLALFQTDNENIVGIYTPLSWDSTSGWKSDMDTFIFNLNKNQKYKKLKEYYSIYCESSYGPYAGNFGCHKSMKSIIYKVDYINNYYYKYSKIFNSSVGINEYHLFETEVYKIIIE